MLNLRDSYCYIQNEACYNWNIIYFFEIHGKNESKVVACQRFHNLFKGT